MLKNIKNFNPVITISQRTCFRNYSQESSAAETIPDEGAVKETIIFVKNS